MAIIIEKDALTFRDVLIVPQYSDINSRTDISLDTQFSRRIKLKCPIVSANMDTVTEHRMAVAMAELGGLGVIHRYNSIAEQVQEVAKVKSKGLLVGAAVGAKKDYLERARALVLAGVDVIVIDVAHAHSKAVLQAIDILKKNISVDLVAGNVATAKGVTDLISAGADGIKIGVGPGCVCSTRIVAGAGIPQLTAILEAAEAARGLVPICADGGIKDPGDAAKALAAGAFTVMVGGLLAGTEESSGGVFYEKGFRYKSYRGMASLAAAQKNDSSLRLDYVPEGVESRVPYVGSAADVVTKLVGGIRSGMSYSGAVDIKEFHIKAKFIKMTSNGWYESLPNQTL